MRKSVLFAFLAFVFFYNSNANAQLSNIINAVSANRDSVQQDTLAVSKDSAKILEMQQALDEARINEMNLRMEMEALRTATIVTDSLKRAERKHRIDSLRSITIATPVIVEGDTLFMPSAAVYLPEKGRPALPGWCFLWANNFPLTPTPFILKVRILPRN